jgi:hypothetical protein
MIQDLFSHLIFILIPIIVICCLTFDYKKSFAITAMFSIFYIYIGVINFNLKSELYYVEIYKNFSPPFLFMIIFFTISFYSRKDRLTIENLKEIVNDLESKYSEMGNKLKQVEEAREILERKILREEDFSIKLHDAISKLSTLNTEEIKMELLRIAAEFINANALAYYDFENKKFFIKYTKNLKKKILPVIGANSQIYDKLVKSTSVLTIKDELKDNKHNILLAGVLRKKNNTILGAILIFDINFIDLNYLNINLFQMICNWGSVEIEKASELVVYQAEFIKFSGTEIFNFVYFTQIINAEYYKTRRFDVFFSLINIILIDEDKIIEEYKTALIKQLGLLLKKNLRICDYLFYNDIKHDRFILLLPFTDYKEAENLAKPLKYHLINADIYPYYDTKKPLETDYEILYIDKNTSEEEFSDILIKQAL